MGSAAEKPKVLLLGTIDFAHEAWQALAETAQIVKPAATNRAEFIAECRSGRLDGVVGAYRTFMSVDITGEWASSRPPTGARARCRGD